MTEKKHIFFKKKKKGLVESIKRLVRISTENRKLMSTRSFLPIEDRCFLKDG